jgi:ribose 5-phosphate isomerase
LIRTEQAPQQHFSSWSGAVYPITDPDLIAEIDAIVGVVEHGLVLDMTDLAPISSGDHVIDRTN